ncbi:unnamed protein product [Owenia fusiformis]|uniref:Uncharacterized protein n=1 Tax=Owenia fusiformis TaxID=6347 RepID=A0A8S4Q4Q4_OWEFU|nr:unnamed protein product [Owenia fusiformis]
MEFKIIIFLAVCVSLTFSQSLTTTVRPSCDRNITSNDIFNAIDSPNYPQYYPTYSSCIYNIIFDKADVPYEVLMYVANFRTYSYSSRRDILRINNRDFYGDGASRSTALQIGQTYAYRAVNYLQLIFYAPTGRSAQGFSLDFVALEDDPSKPNITERCDEITCLNGGTCHSHGPDGFKCYCISGYTGDFCEYVPNTHDCPKFFNEDALGVGEIRSTYYPSRYPSRHYCDFIIFNTTVGHTMSIYVDDFQTESRYDTLCIGDPQNPSCYSGDGRSSSSAMRVGETYFYEITDTIFRLNFRTDSSRSYRGFRLLYAILDPDATLNVTTAGRTNKGTEFSFAYLPHQYNSVSGNNQLYVTSEVSGQVTVFLSATGETNNYTVDPLTPLVVDLPGSMRVTEGLEQKGIRIESDVNVTVAAYSSTVGSADGFLVLPEANLGTQYVVASYTPYPGSYSYITIVGLDNLTSAWLIFRNESANDGFGGYDYDNAIEVQVVDVQSYTYRSQSDLTGTLVVADGPISVISGCDYAQIPTDVISGDQIVEMLPPVIALGFEFIVPPIAERIGGEIIRVIAWTDDTDVNLPISGFTTELDEGEFVDITASSGLTETIACTKKCLVVQYNMGNQRDSVGSDPFMSIVPPVEQYTQNHIFVRPANFRSYVNVVILQSDVNGLQINGINVTSLTTFRDVPNTGYTAGQIPLDNFEEFLLSHVDGDDIEWLAMLYGHSSNSNIFRGYGYPLGMQLNPVAPRATEPPKETDPPVTAPTGNITERCRCNFRVLGNESAGEEEFGTLVHDLEDTLYFFPQQDCESCRATLHDCPLDCRREVLEEWGTEGLASEIIVEVPGSIRLKALGQVMCERHYTRIPPPGRKLGVFYRSGSCVEEDSALLIGRVTAGPYLCCTEADIPIVGTVPAWDVDCDGEFNYLKTENMLANIADLYKLKGLKQDEIDRHIQTIRDAQP